MKRRSLPAALAALAIVAIPAVAAADYSAANATWRAYGGDGASASILVVNKDEADNPEAHYVFFMSCTAVEQWMMNVSDIDAKVLGTTISDGGQPSFGLVLDGKADVDAGGGYFPDIIFNQLDGVWEYSTNWDLGLLDSLLAAKQIGVKGTGIDRALPTDGMDAALAKFKTDCEALRGTTDEGESDEPVIDVPEDEQPQDVPEEERDETLPRDVPKG
jgi:hypothetical protein